MKALIYLGPNKGVRVEDRPKPTIVDSTDAIIRLTKSTICGSDLHILKGDVPTCPPGRVLGHEGVGIVEKAGQSVRGIKEGDLVIISAITTCALCKFCRRGMLSHCEDGGWRLGHTIDGCQAEYVRVPHAGTSVHLVPKGQDAARMVLISDILPTGLECGVLNAKVEPGNTVAIVGAGPVGLAALLTAQLYSPSQTIVVDQDDYRLGVAKELGATTIINSAQKDPIEAIKSMTDGLGVDCVMEAVGIPATFELCQEIIAPGGTIANIGVHGTKCDLHLEKLWAHNITITTRLLHNFSAPMLLSIVGAGKIDTKKLITHTFKFGKVEQAYETFQAASQNKALKVIIDFE